MKTILKISFCIYIFGFIGCSLEQRENFFETTLSKYDLTGGYSIEIVHDDDWEMSIPLTFRAYREGKGIFESGVFGGIDPSDVNNFRNIFSILPVDNMENVYVFIHNDEPNEVVAFVDFTSNDHYPFVAYNEAEYEQIGKTFLRIQKSLGSSYSLKDYYK